jgi:hypothetical protein
MSEFKMPTETISLPSRGLLYPKESPLSTGEIEMKYMTAKEEDILTNANYIKDGSVLNRVMQSLIVTPVSFNDILVCDKNAILLGARILGYGAEYQFKNYNYNTGEEELITVDLSTLKEKEVDLSIFQEGKNEFTFTMPLSGNEVTFKLLTHGDEQAIDAEIKGLKKITPQGSFEITTRLKYIITSVNGKRELASIRDFVDNGLTAKDARALREYYAQIQPDIDMTYYSEGAEEGISVPVGINFFWPDSGR